MTDDRMSIEAGLVRELVASQFPQWAALPIRPVQWNGWDNTTFHLGDTMKVRLPTAARYVAQVEKEQLWLPRLAPHLPYPIPVPLAAGAPSPAYPWPWSVYTWLPGEVAERRRIADLPAFATDLAGFLLALQRIDTAGGPPAGEQNFFRGGPLAVYDAETRACIAALGHRIDAAAATAAWEASLATTWPGPPVWVHGDIASGNLLVDGGRLSAVIDFGSCGIGDPACDLVIAWVFLDGASRDSFRAALPADPGTWARARGWALWKALLMLARDLRVNPAERPPRQVIDDVLAEHAAAG